MTHEDIFDCGRIEAQLLESVFDLFFDGVVVKRIDQDDPFRRRYRPRRDILAADEVQVVKDLRRLRIPLRDRRDRPLRRRVCLLSVCSLAGCGLGLITEIDHAGKVLFRSRLCRCHVGLGRACRCLGIRVDRRQGNTK